MKAEQAWQAVLGHLQVEMPKSTFDTWVKESEFIAYEDGSFVVGVANAFSRDWLESRLKSTATRMLTGMLNRSVELRFVVWQQEIEQKTKKEIDETPNQDSLLQPSHNRTLNTAYTFKNFVVGASNRLAHAAALALIFK